MIFRTGEVMRQTRETQVEVRWNMDGRGKAEVATGIGFLDHLLAQLAQHGLFDLVVSAKGDLEVDEHHTVEDVAITLGQALDRALGERLGIRRFGDATVPLDEALAMVAVDLGGRGYAVVEPMLASLRVGELPGSLVIHFLETFAREGRLNLHARVLYGRDDHHKLEALFKALARALEMATRIEPRFGGQVPSTKGALGGG